MGLLDSVIGAMGQGGSGGGGQGALLNAVVGMLANNAQGGGLAGLVNQFQQGGLGDVVASWISTGRNLPVSADQVHQALGPDTIGALAQQLGLSHGDVAGQLSQLLPQVVDKLTPNGQVPAGGLGDIGGLLGSLMGR
jgi:uncharacterized protein YidB (DUF937 family)